MGCAISIADISALSVESFSSPGATEVSTQCDNNPVQGPPDESFFWATCDTTTTFTCPAGETLLINGVMADDYQLVCPKANQFLGLTTNDAGEWEPQLFDQPEFPTLTCESVSGMTGDPHIQKWDRSWYDWQGECDTVFLSAPDVPCGGLDIHTRTKSRYDYSFIESAAIRIGTDVLEISSFGDSIFNGISNHNYPLLIGDDCGGGYNVTYSSFSDMEHAFHINLHDENEGVVAAKLDVSTFKDMVSVKLTHNVDSPLAEEWFGSSVGLMGTYHDSKTLARDGITLLENPNDLGQEWQVLDSDPKLFQNPDRAPQFPEKCNLPKGATTKEKRRRRLGEGISKDQAAEACAHWKDVDMRANCIADVMATNDLQVANQSY